MIQELPIIESQADIDKLFPDKYDDERRSGKQVRVIGRYQQTNSSKAASRNPNLPPLYVGMVSIILVHSSILLYPFGHPLGIRPADEIAQLENKRVVVVGQFVRYAGPYHSDQQGLVGPCMLTVESIFKLYSSKVILC